MKWPTEAVVSVITMNTGLLIVGYNAASWWVAAGLFMVTYGQSGLIRMLMRQQRKGA